MAEAEDQIQLRTVPVTASNWRDLVTLFEGRGGPHHCWCMVWRGTTEERKRANVSRKKSFLKKRVTNQTPIGLLAYLDQKPVAWCSVAPRDTYLRLHGDDSVKKVWSLVCFYIKREYQAQGFSRQLIWKAQQYAKQNGAQFLEAYPVAPDSPSFRFMGFMPVFNKLGFKFIKKAGTRRNVMLCRL